MASNNSIEAWVNDPALTERQRYLLDLLKDNRYMDIFKEHFAQDLIFAERMEDDGDETTAFRVRHVISQRILKMAEIMKIDAIDAENKVTIQSIVDSLAENIKKKD